MADIMQESIYGALMLTILCMGMLAGTMCFLFRDREFRVVSITAIALFVLSVLLFLFCLELTGINLSKYGLCHAYRKAVHVLYGIGLYGWFRFCKWTASRLYDRWWSE